MENKKADVTEGDRLEMALKLPRIKIMNNWLDTAEERYLNQVCLWMF